VPDLLVAREPRDAAYWEKWISEGKEGTLMPGFGRKRGGPLTAEQIASLVEYAMTRLPTEPSKN
jgi:mono/diheme cytochrome c family protein